MTPAPASARREALRTALAEAGRSWLAVNTDDEIAFDGWCSLLSACERTSVSRERLEGLARDDDLWGWTARVLLAAIDSEGAPERSTLCRPSEHSEAEVCSLAQALAVLRERGVANAIASRSLIRTLQANRYATVATVEDVKLLAAAEALDDRNCGGRIKFDEAACAPVDVRQFARALQVDAEEFARAYAGDGVVVRVRDAERRAAAEYALSGCEPDQIWDWPKPSEVPTIVAPPMTFSATRLNTFAQCPRRWFFTYLCDAIEDPGSAAAAYGKAFHEALEAVHRDVRFPLERDPAEILDRLCRELDAAFARAGADFSCALERETARQRARRMAAEYVRRLCAQAKDDPMEVAHVELAQRWSRGGYEFVGFIDRIDRPLGGGPVTIFDYKTGRIEDDPQEYLGRIRKGEEAQLPLYYGMRESAGETVGRLALISIRDARDDAWVLALDVVDESGKPVREFASSDAVLRATCSRADLEEVLDALVDRCDLLRRRGLEHFAAGVDPPCSFCAYARACRERPAQAERIFAR